MGSGYGTLNFGYLVQNGNRAILLVVKDIYLTPETNIDTYRKVLDETFIYMIKTMEFY